VTLSCIVAGAGPLVIAAHGFPDDARTFGAQVPALVEAGYRVVMPTLRGYSPSGVARSGRHDAVAAGEDLLELADHYSPGGPVRLIGHDWGAVAAFAAAALAPARFSHLATLAVPHLRAAMPYLATADQLRRSWYIGLFQLRGVAEARLRARDFELIDDLWRDWSPGYRASPEDLRSIKEGIRDRVGPVLSYYRALLSPRVLRRARLLFAPTRVPAIHLHGVDDGCFGVASTTGSERFYDAPYVLHRIDGAGHFLHREKPAEINALLLDFFES
jgi:pimeloyl-ACP methyl ester carboxylesterase